MDITSICFPNALVFRNRFLPRRRVGDTSVAKLILVSTVFLVVGCTVTKSHAGRGTETILYAPRPLKVEQDPTPYYPDASKRAKETGKVILRFRIGADGIAQEPFIVDEATSTSAPRLIKAAKQLFQRSRYEIGEGYRHEVTASVLFEIMPCGKLLQASGFDYYYHPLHSATSAYARCAAFLNAGYARNCSLLSGQMARK